MTLSVTIYFPAHCAHTGSPDWGGEKPRVALQHNRNVVSVKHTASKAPNHCAAKQACKSCVILGNYDDLIISLTAQSQHAYFIG